MNPCTALPGDIVLTRSHGLLGRVIRLFTRSFGESRTKVNHVGIIVKEGTPPERAILVEALSKVKRHALATRYGDTRTDVAIYRPLNLSQKDKRTIVRTAEGYVGRSYGYFKLILHLLDWMLLGAYIFRRLACVDAYPICSWLVAHCYRKVRKNFRIDPGAASPDDIWDFVTTSRHYTCVRPLHPLKARFTRYIGIDYSGAKYPTTPLRGLQIYESLCGGEPTRVGPMSVPHNARNWTRCTLAKYLEQVLVEKGAVVVGIDHGFSFPYTYMDRHDIRTWDAFLADFVQHWPTDCSNKQVDRLIFGNPRRGKPNEFRLCEKWTSSAKSVFQFRGPGVAHSTHAGLPWLRWLRMRLPRSRVHFWPFDGFHIPENKSVVAEVYPSLFRRRYEESPANEHERDAWSVAKWLCEMDCTGRLDHYFTPELLKHERSQALLEGWILGVR